jgi:hypothetical protein
MHRHALVNKSGRVENVIVWDGDTDKWQPPADCSAVISDALNIGDYVEGFAPSLEELDALKSAKIIAIKSAAQEKIYAIIPAWKQSNLNARMNELNMIRFGREWTADELAQIAVMTAIWEQIKAIRAESSAAESAVYVAATIEEISAVQF